MVPFQYVRAHNDAEAIAAGAQPQTRFIAGGTNLLDLMKYGIEAPARLVDINGLGLDSIDAKPDGPLIIGALARNSDTAYHPDVRERFPMLSEALLSGASPQLRNMATVGGNLLQRTRCYYFYDTAFACNKRQPGSGCDAIQGYNRIHAVLGTSEKCIAAHPSDMAVALVALDALIHTKGSEGERTIPLTDFYLEPGDTPERETVLKPGELITQIEIPPLDFARRSTYRKVRDRSSYAFALVSVAAAVQMIDGRIQSARLAFGGIGSIPWRSREAEQVLAGSAPGQKAFDKAADAVVHDARPREHNRFKVALARRTLAVTLRQLTA